MSQGLSHCLLQWDPEAIRALRVSVWSFFLQTKKKTTLKSQDLEGKKSEKLWWEGQQCCVV